MKKEELSEAIKEGIDNSIYGVILKSLVIGIIIGLAILFIFLVINVIGNLKDCGKGSCSYPIKEDSPSLTERELNFLGKGIKYGCDEFILHYFNDTIIDYQEKKLIGYEEVEEFCDMKDSNYYLHGECITPFGLSHPKSTTQTASIICVKPLEVAKQQLR